MRTEVDHALGISTGGLHLARRELALTLLQQRGSAELGSGQSPTLTDFLNQQGKNGWELISAIAEYELQKRTVGPGYVVGSQVANTMRMFFKRSLP
jgi:hypothetical protein